MPAGDPIRSQFCCDRAIANLGGGLRCAMKRHLAALTIVLLVGTVLTRVFLMKRRGITALYFGNIDNTDFLIPPFAIFYFYLILAFAFDLPSVSKQEFFRSEVISWAGVLLCLAGLLLLLASLVSFGNSFRIGIDTEHANKLVTTGVFALSRNPMYVAFAFVLLGEFLVFPNWIVLIYVAGGIWLFHRQVLREEENLKKLYGQEYTDYCSRVRRYL
jgi:protein-S-isoprenylcysteine O-methyltransferase Ste14